MRNEIVNAISNGVSTLTEMQLNTGEFVYRTGPSVPTPDIGHNILRHSGAVYALSECSGFSNSPLKNAVRAGIRWVALDHTKLMLNENKWMLAVASDDKMTKEFNELKLGGTALYISAICSALENRLCDFPPEVLERLGVFLLLMQQKDGRFHSKMFRKSGRISQNFVSLYYPGEAALALTELGRRNPAGPWFGAASRGLCYLGRLRKGLESVEPDHWSLIATAQLLNTGYDLPEQSRETICDHAEQVVSSMVLEFDNIGKDGCCTGDGQTCPTATRLEGLTAIYSLLARERNQALAERVLDVIEQHTRFLIDAQYASGPRKGGFPKVSEKWLRDHNHASNKRSHEVRIDYIQHAICGLRGALAVLCK